MSFLAPLMTELILGSASGNVIRMAGNVVHKIEEEFRPILKEKLSRKLTGVVSSQISKDANGIVATVVRRSSKHMRSCACHGKSSGRKIG